MTIATAVYCIFQLVENYESNKHLLKDHDFVIIPVVNPGMLICYQKL